MRTVLIAQQDVEFANSLAADLAAVGYRTVTCPGPWPPAVRCIRCEVGYCPLTEAADLLIYDPDLVGLDANGEVHLLAAESAIAHPDVSLLLAWPGDEEPASLASVLAEVPSARRAPKEPGKLAELAWELAGPPYEHVKVAV